MRDPDGQTVFEGDQVRRVTRQPVGSEHFLRSRLAQEWVESGRMTDFAIQADQAILSPRLPFVSYPHEWCNLQLYRAGALTLQLQKEAIARGFDLKDASAWNIIFDGARPMFCDLLSPVPLAHKTWWAAGQFARHFILPLLLAARGRLDTHQAFLLWRDGVAPSQAKRLLGCSAYFTRCAPLFFTPQHAATSTSGSGSGGAAAPAVVTRRQQLVSGLEWMLSAYRPNLDVQRGGVWQDYVHRRHHYPDHSLQAKRETVFRWVQRAKPRWVVDFGCNTGEFSEIAEGCGAQVLAIDGDHAAIERLYAKLSASPEPKRIQPLVAQLDDVLSGRGWAGDEYPGLMERLQGRAEVVLMLALLHHLMVAAAVPLDQIAAFAKSMNPQLMVIELIGVTDPQLRLLCEQRQRDVEEFSLAKQAQAFERQGWRILEQVPLPGTDRILALMELA